MSDLTLRRAVVTGRLDADGASTGRVRLLGGPLAGGEFGAVLYPQFSAGGFGEDPGIAVGQEVLVNTLGVEMGLGTGGVVFVVPEADAEVGPIPNNDHFVKLPYTPLQFPAQLPKGVHGTSNASARGDLPEADLPLRGVPVVVLGLHSHLAVACSAAASRRRRVSFVWQEGGALGVGFSGSVRELRSSGLLGPVVSVGACFGGDLEAPNIYSGLEVAASAGDIVLVGIGPGIVGTNSRYGHGGMSAAGALNAACALGARPVLAPRLSAAEPRERHRGISHHTLTALEATLAGCRVAVPESGCELPADFRGSGRHEFVPSKGSAAGLEGRFGLTFRSMGRGYMEDPVFFDAAAAAVEVALSEEVGA
ncbi:DUF3866 family protein [Rubrobacter indicoceani]|uniref:DUF3866 family protein n=1 Tax=Rubrobacter indicoceani TaxID=2051957 RepID=UPI000E5AE8ED|nr:DUF3866 family protein [Rubrobacter indicoceani]